VIPYQGRHEIKTEVPGAGEPIFISAM